MAQTAFESRGGTNELLTVVMGFCGEEVDSGKVVSEWGEFAQELGQSLALEPALELVAASDERDVVDELLTRAAIAPAPVLVLPRRHKQPVQTLEPHELHRVLIASDASHEVAQGARALQRHLRGDGVSTTVLLVLAANALPRIWEGTGHQAAAWRSELFRRHGPDVVTVADGMNPANALREQSCEADLLIMLWRQAADAGRAPVVRSVLEGALEIPCLLVPLVWVRPWRPSRPSRRPGDPDRRVRKVRGAVPSAREGPGD